MASESVEEILRGKLLVPSKTRWNSFYDALYKVIENPLVDLNKLCTALGVRCITEKEYQFLKEYCMVVKPLTRALDILQGEDNCYHGMILPTIESMIIRTLEIKKDVSRMTSGLPDVIVEVNIVFMLIA